MAELRPARPSGPWVLPPNRVPRFYTGGALIDRLRGVPAEEARDTDRPEDWLGSVTAAWTPSGEPASDLGLSRVDDGGPRVLLRELLERDPAAVGGSALVRRAGVTTGLLVKLLDAAVRLPVHCHPTRAFARRHLGSFFGKAEAWIVLDTRSEPDAEPPDIWLGFRRDMAADELRRIVEEGDTATLLEALHRRSARRGDTWFVPPGLPHAIGAGLLIAEVQEPSDVSILAETRDVGVTREAATAGLPIDVAIEAFDRRGWSDAAIDGLRQAPHAEPARAGLRRTHLVGRAAAPFFRAERLVVDRPARPWDEEAFLVALVLDGEGVVRVGEDLVPVAPGTAFAVPAAGLPRTEVAGAAPGRPMTLLAAMPPRPGDLVDPDGADRP